MSDKLGQTLDELIQKDRENKKFPKGPNKNQSRGKQMRRKLSGGQKAPSAWDKAKKLRKEKVQRFGDDRRPIRNTKKLIKAEDEEVKQVKQSTKLKVLNLNRSITNEDLNELFNHIGPLTECRREYDEFGRPLGSASVAFEHAKDAKKAFDEYNGGELDGNVMVIQFVADNKSKRQYQPSKLKVVERDGKRVIEKV
ncbi:unnamed protein product [Moneuplotes crassus]|uniref:RRM domain-containing protein n=1 Tax=Euplotes crassus TaxID=5936 RepID=A0AAD1XX97_EUPCR|nr:unnamed protein product [Moneuplotes crassus]